MQAQAHLLHSPVTLLGTSLLQVKGLRIDWYTPA